MATSKSDSSTYLLSYIGSFIFIGASLAGVIGIMPDLQLATSMRQRPDTMSLATFIEEGPKENAFIRLTDVDVDLENSYEIISTTRRRGFRTSRSSGIIANLYPLNLIRSSPVIAMRAPESYEEAWEKAIDQGIVEGRIVPKMLVDSLDGMKRHINSNNAGSVRWTIEPLKRRPELKQAKLNFLYALLIGAIGLAIACLGESNAGTLASFISYLGSPLRVRPFSMVWPGFYVVTGLALVGCSYETIMDYGKLGSIYFNGLMLSAGYMLAQVGLGAICSAVVVPGIYYLFDESSSTKSKSAYKYESIGSVPPPLPVAASRLPYTEAEFRSPQYRDPVLSREFASHPVTSGVLLEDDQVPAELLGQKVHQFQAQDVSGNAFCKIYLGCSGLVLSEQVVCEGHAEVRLYSLLGDGLMVVTTHRGNTLVDQNRQGSTALVQIVETDDSASLMMKLFDAHLAKCEKLKSGRGTHLESLSKEDTESAWLYARRAVAEMRFQYGLAEFEVGPLVLGRFHYPTGATSSPPFRIAPPVLPIAVAALKA